MVSRNRVTFLEFGKTIKMATRNLEPAVVQASLAKFARRKLGEVIASGEGSPNYETYVNGRRDAREETVTLPGPIVYQFIWWRPIITFAMELLREGSPRGRGAKTERYFEAWRVMVDGAYVSEADWGSIGTDKEIFLVNIKPYHRIIETGHTKTKLPHRLVYRTRSAISRRYTEVVSSKYTMARIPNPYILKGRFRMGSRPMSRKKLRLDTQAGAEMTYPAIVLSMRSL